MRASAPAAGSAIGVGFWAAVLTVLVTAAFAVVGVATPPRSGPFCGTACVPHPYTDVAQFVPGDYLWLIPGLALVPIFVVLLVAIHAVAAESTRMFSRIALVRDRLRGHHRRRPLPSPRSPSPACRPARPEPLGHKYNPHGPFIAGEALGYLTMSLSLLFAALVFVGPGIERAIRWLFIADFLLLVTAAIGLWLIGGDLVAFEVSALSINWLVPIACGVLLSVVFRRAAPARSVPS